MPESSSPMDVSILMELVDYDPITGVLTWKERRPEHFNGAGRNFLCKKFNERFAGKPAITTKSRGGYGTSTILGQRVMAHRVAWCIHHKKAIPKGCLVDHINGDTSDNRASNLRLCTPSQSSINVQKNISGVRGAVFHKNTGKYQASIRIHLGTFNSEEEASTAYENAAKIFHGDFYLKNNKREP